LAPVRPSGRGFNPIEDDFFAREAELYEGHGSPSDEASEWEGDESRPSRRPLMVGVAVAITVAAMLGVVRLQPKVFELQALRSFWRPTPVARPTTPASAPVLTPPAATSKELPPVARAEPAVESPKPEVARARQEPEPEVTPAEEAPAPTPHHRASRSSAKFASALSRCRAESSADHVRRALDACRKAVALQPRSSEALTLLAHTEIDRHHSREAVRFATAAISADPQFSDAYVMMGKARQQAGQRSQARASYRQYLALAPQGRYAGEVRRILSRGH
jgi:tetratricopeptide (TPR) repeat protein